VPLSSRDALLSHGVNHVKDVKNVLRKLNARKKQIGYLDHHNIVLFPYRNPPSNHPADAKRNLQTPTPCKSPSPKE
jgi:hypothetical protein